MRFAISIAIAMLCFLFGMVKSSLAFEITSMSVDNGASGCYVSLTTDEDIYSINWYIDNECNPSTSTMPNDATRDVYVNVGYLPGDIKGVKYEITARVRFWDDDDEVFRSDTDSYTVRVFEGIYLHQVGENTGAKGSVGISRFYYNGSHIVMDSYAYASNPTNNPEAKNPDDNPMIVAPWFRTNQYAGPNGAHIPPEHRNTKTLETIKVGETSQYFTPGTYNDKCRKFDRWVGTLTEESEPLYFLAHTHLQVYTTKAPVKIDDWEVDTGVLEFTHKDGP